MTDYNSYRFMGFWFQPDRVSMDDANPFTNNGYLKKYWDEDTYTQAPENSLPNIFENYYNFNFDSSMQQIQNSSSLYNSYYNIDFGNYGSSSSQGNYSYDSVLNNFRTQVSNYKNETNESRETATGGYSSYFNSLFN